MKGMTREHRIAGALYLLAAAVVIGGMVLYASIGIDLEEAVRDGTMASYLEAASGSAALVLNYGMWIVTALLVALGSVALAVGSRTLASALGAAVAVIAAAVALPTYLLAMTLVVAAADEGAVDLASVLGWMASRADWTTTALLLGLAPALLSWSGPWAPGWMRLLGVASAACGAVAIAVLPIESLAPAGYAVLVTGPMWLLAAGVVLVSPSRGVARAAGGAGPSTPPDRSRH
ncbi:hypothetical protein HT102_09750 [Hoyosella sp. G463]|uniref:DUF4386 family protein n=1 Tax=Lolliginicoccus lacisalsi TaxID=2742202 RepID=A0A927JCR5_9ACTN|nr:hypothetical protein [Lolliginicoccus lacisalsi]MBD8506770.1 hypothetical protein [Lolliginicoccus lacisalsi]